MPIELLIDAAFSSFRMNPGGDEGGERNILRADIGFNDSKQIESYFTSRRILSGGRRGTKSRL